MVDLKINRRESGLCNKDLAHLLDVSPSRIARLQTGNAALTAAETIALSLVFGKTADQLLPTATKQIASSLKQRLAFMPSEPEGWMAHDRRLDTLNNLTTRLLSLTTRNHEQ